MWTIERCRWLQRVGDYGPLEVVFGGPHMSMPSLNAVTVGDTLYPVMVNAGNLHIVAGMTVQALIPPEDYVRNRFGIVVPPVKMWDSLFRELKAANPSVGHRFPVTCADIAATSDNGSAIRFDRQIPGEALASLRLGAMAGREMPLKGVQDGQFKNNFSLQGRVRRLSADSARLFADCL